MKSYTETDLKELDRRITQFTFSKALEDKDWDRAMFEKAFYDTLWELRWAIISHMELQEKLSERS